jgi:hypothetical protein
MGLKMMIGSEGNSQREWKFSPYGVRSINNQECGKKKYDMMDG